MKYFSLFVFFYTSLLFGQTTRHTECYDIRLRIVKALRFETKDNLDSLNGLLKKSPHKCMQIQAIYNEGSINYLLNSNFDEAEKKYLECIRLTRFNKSKIDELCYKSFILTSVNRLFYLYRREGKLEKSLEIILKNKDVMDPGRFQELIAVNEYDFGNYEKAIKIFRNNLQIIDCEHIKFQSPEKEKIMKIGFHRTSNIHNLIADSFLQLYIKTKKASLLDSAVVHYEKSYSKGNLFNGNIEYNKALYYSRLAKTEFYRKNYNKAVSYYNTFFNHTVMKENVFTFQSYCIGLAENYVKLLKPDLALECLSKFDSSYTIKPGSEQFYIASLSAYMDAYQQKGNNEKALWFAKRYLMEIKKIESDKIKAKTISNVLDIQEIKEKAQKIIDSRNYWITILILLGSCLILTLFILVRVNKLKTKKRQEQHKEIIGLLKKEIASNENQRPIKTPEGHHEKMKFLKDFAECKQILEKFLEIEKNKEYLDPDFKLSSLAKKLDTNTTYLSSFFNYYLEKGFHQYLQEKRIEYLLELINTDSVYRRYTVQAISEHVGYKSPSAFSKVFKQYTGISYSTYLKQISE
ncbi:MAG TPA: AraC family transcriptional regulator [Flavobacterium sp.]